MDEFCNFCAFLKSTILTQKNVLKTGFLRKVYNVSDFEFKILKRVSFKNKNFKMCQFVKQRFYNMSDLELKILKRVRFQNRKFKTCQILKQKFYNMSDFELKILKRIRFCEKIIYIKSHLSPPHIFFTTFSSIKPCTITAYNIFVN